jgi:hypothetical protein
MAEGRPEMTSARNLAFAMMLPVILAAGLATAADSGDAIPYPAGYRKWVHVKSAVVGATSPFFKSGGGIHHIYANEKAMEGFTSGQFPDGAALVFDLLKTTEKDGTIFEDARERIDVMVKDSKRFMASGGWGFERFQGDSQSERPLTEEHRKQCFTCHEQRRSQDLVFSTFRK